MHQANLRSIRLAIRKFKRLLEFLVYGWFDSLVLVTAPKAMGKKSGAAVVRLNLLGDFFLWLPYGVALIRHLRDQNQRIVLVCNQAWADLALRHFPDVEVFAIDRGRVVKEWRYRARTLRNLRRLGIAATHHPTCPRDFLVEDTTVRALGAPAAGFDAVFPDRLWIDRVFYDRYYRILVPPLTHAHQTAQNHAYLRHVSVPESHLAKLPHPRGKLDDKLRGDAYYVIAPGASRKERRWPVERFAELAQRIRESHPRMHCMVVGTMGERALGDHIVDGLEGQGRNLAGQTSLMELIDWIGQARFVVGNDSAAAHIAAAQGVPSVAVIGGGHFGRCFPYDPTEARVERLPVSVFHPMECYGCDWICRYPTRPNGCFPCVDAVTVDKVWQAVQALPLAEPRAAG
ncbi:glycosyltransferase family 9 protein [Candidatus Methylocalor cossyra]|uniref:ADP-heptose:LPS heptosyltransferase n=1 Tax=Candidatus Methylocalor cossyra TaxID=3108543 RepID=A0ABM9NHV4_9GAMM